MIDRFSREYHFLSNFYSVGICYEGKMYPSVEHAFVAAKTTENLIRELIQCAPTAAEAKSMGRRLRLRADWEDIKLEVMTQLVREKFNNNYLIRDKLLATGDQELVEGNDWGDTYWGACNGVGENNLGKILMQVRKEINGSDPS